MSEGNNLFQWTAMKPENVTLILEHGASLFRIHTPALRAITIIVRDEKSPFNCLKKKLAMAAKQVHSKENGDSGFTENATEAASGIRDAIRKVRTACASIHGLCFKL